MQPIVHKFQSADFQANSKWYADALADNSVSKIIGAWNENSPLDNALPWENIKSSIQHFPQSLRNDQITAWEAPDTYQDKAAKETLEQFIRTAGELPAWADRDKIEIASDVFMGNGALSSVILFCSSLPECYYYPSISTLLHASGNLEHQTAYRIRSTATMVFPVMLGGGLTRGDGCGILPIVRSRFTHAIIRNLVLRGNPADRCRLDEGTPIFTNGLVIERIGDPPEKKNAFQSIFFNGWDLGKFGMPCNQEEQAYVLLCFSHVFLRGMHKMGVKLTSSQEDAFLHTWNVIGHILGIDAKLMAATQDEAECLLSRIRSTGFGSQDDNPGQPTLTHALINTMEEALPYAILKPLPTLMVQHLRSSFPAVQASQQRRSTNFIAKSLFNMALFAATRFDKMALRLNIQFSIIQATINILGKRFVVEILKMDPNTLHQNIDSRRWQTAASVPMVNKTQQFEDA
jgi:hypothetical protein